MTAAVGRRAPLVGLLAANTVSLTGNMLTVIALPLYVLAETGSPVATGIAGAVATAPVVLGGAFGGVLVDRIGYRRASVLADVVSCLTIGAVPLLDRTLGLPFWVLLALVFLSGLLDTPGQTARNALLPEAAASAGVPVERAVGLFQATDRAARLIGAPVAGLLVAALGALPVLAVDAVTFVVSALLVAALVPDPARSPTDPVDGGTGGYWRDFADGIRFLLREPLLRAVVALVLVTNFFDATKSAVLLPVVADREFGGGPAINPLLGAVELDRVPAGLRARVFGVIGAGCWAAIPIGALSAGFASDRFGTTATLVAIGAGYLLVVLTPLFGGPWRTMDRPPTTADPTAGPVTTAA